MNNAVHNFNFKDVWVDRGPRSFGSVMRGTGWSIFVFKSSIVLPPVSVSKSSVSSLCYCRS